MLLLFGSCSSVLACELHTHTSKYITVYNGARAEMTTHVCPLSLCSVFVYVSRRFGRFVFHGDAIFGLQKWHARTVPLRANAIARHRLTGLLAWRICLLDAYTSPHFARARSAHFSGSPWYGTLDNKLKKIRATPACNYIALARTAHQIWCERKLVSDRVRQAKPYYKEMLLILLRLANACACAFVRRERKFMQQVTNTNQQKKVKRNKGN